MLPSDAYLSRCQPLVGILILSLGCCNAYSDDRPVPQAIDGWIRGTSNNLEMRIRGEILDVDGMPAQKPSILVSIKDNNSSEPVDVSLEGHRFEG